MQWKTSPDNSRQLDVSAMTTKIDQLEQRAMHLRLPIAYDSPVYTMRVHIGLLRSHLGSILSNENIKAEGSPRSRKGSDLSDASPSDQKSVE
jgi:hypothetical protein